MKAHHQLFGLYTPTGSWVHRMPAGAKFAILTLTTLPVVLLRNPWLSVGLVTLAVAMLVASRIPLRRSLGVRPLFWVVVAVVVAYPLLFGRPVDALVTGANIVGAFYLGRVITMTTPAMDLVETLVRVARPLDWIGFSSERFGLAVMVMLRSVPYLVDSFSRVGESARARGIDRNLFARVTPVIVDAVSYATRTGEAMIARGLADDTTPEAGRTNAR
ncbi:energy-coupling factor transporter transmembrane component T family protein [Propionibacteriaceae bacterium Y1923]|uniref:energy-coupling factor transporter transmembrane component T family protein n=1 Tax=Aestuariimicrobium sp. Y1814 TaxID=3418742 RepID=UPI003C137539